ncbi:hypothetical protein BGX38DRAFT_1274851 [Terfezia claveryi]|nr:hypothetical protein BGX38DRAFT_1274851 [Terfezia claveryi]
MNSVSTNTDRSIHTSPVRTYAEAATNTRQTHRPPLPKDKGKGRAEEVPPPSRKQKPRQTSEGKGKEPAKAMPPPTTPPKKATTHAAILHGAPTKYKPGLMRRWIDEDNQKTQTLGILATTRR